MNRMTNEIEHDSVMDPQSNVHLQKRRQLQWRRQLLSQSNNAIRIVALSLLVFFAVNIPHISARQQQQQVTSIVPKKALTITRPTIPSKLRQLHSSSSSSKQVQQQHEHNAHSEELMTAPTAVANVLADLCPHGMLPIGTSKVNRIE
jgi:hypothetical protein